MKKVEDYHCIPDFITIDPISSIEDLNVIAPDSIGQNVPIKYLYTQKPTRDAIKSGYWTESQRNLMKLIDKEYDKLAEYIIKNF